MATREEQRQEQIQRVETYRAWLRSPNRRMRDIPLVPSDADYRQWRQAEREKAAAARQALADARRAVV